MPVSKAMRDSAFRVEEPDSVAPKVEKEAWQTVALAFLKAQEEDNQEAESLGSGRKQSRLPAYYHLVAVDNMLKAVLPNGLSTFMPIAEEPGVGFSGRVVGAGSCLSCRFLVTLHFMLVWPGGRLLLHQANVLL